MSTKGEQTRLSMVATAAELMRKQGYHGTGLNEILARSGAPRGSLYFHFPGGKDELTAEALAAAGHSWTAILIAEVEGEKNLGRAIVRICERLAQELTSSEFERGCPVATVTLEVAASNPAIQKVVAEHFQALEVTIAERFVAAGRKPRQAAEAATFVLSSIEGALLLCRAYRDTKPLTRVGAQLAAWATK